MKDAKILQFTGEPSYFKQATTALKKLTDAEAELKRAQVKADQALQMAQSKLRPLIAQAKSDNRYDNLKSKLMDELTASNNTTTKLSDLGFDRKEVKMNTIRQQMAYHARQYHRLKAMDASTKLDNIRTRFDRIGVGTLPPKTLRPFFKAVDLIKALKAKGQEPTQAQAKYLETTLAWVEKEAKKGFVKELGPREQKAIDFFTKNGPRFIEYNAQSKKWDAKIQRKPELCSAPEYKQWYSVVSRWVKTGNQVSSGADDNVVRKDAKAKPGYLAFAAMTNRLPYIEPK